MTFEFVSKGPQGIIYKTVQFQHTNLINVFNLSFGDKDIVSGEINDMVISDNGDSDKILATIAASVYIFTDMYPQALVYATGSTKSRTRLYRMGISKFLSAVEIDFEIFGELSHKWEQYRKNVDYEGFIVRRKTKK